MRTFGGYSKSVLVGGVCFLALLCGILFWVVGGHKVLGGEMLRFAPGDTIAVGFVDLREHLELKKLNQHLESAQPELKAEIGRILKDSSWSLEQLEKWVVPAGMAVVFGDASEPLMTSKVLEAGLIFPLNSERAFRQFVSENIKLESLPTVEIEGVTCYLIPSQEGPIAVADGHLIFSSSEAAMGRLLRAYDGDNVLASQDFEQALGELHDKAPIAFLYVRTSAVSGGSAPWVVGSVALHDQILTTEGFLAVEADTPLGKVLLQEPRMDGETLAYIPPGASGVTAIDVSYFSRAALALQQELGEDALSASEQTKLEEVLNLAKGELVLTTDLLEMVPRITQSLIYGGGPPKVSGILVVEAQNFQSAQKLRDLFSAESGDGKDTEISGHRARVHKNLVICATEKPLSAVLLSFGPRAQDLLKESLQASEGGVSATTDDKIRTMLEDSARQNLVLMDYTDFYQPVYALGSTYGSLLGLLLQSPIPVSDILANPYLKQALQSAFYVQVEPEGLRLRGYGLGNPFSVAAVMGGLQYVVDEME